jgi:hypothetical protein
MFNYYKTPFPICIPKCLFDDVVYLMSKLIEFHFAHVTEWRLTEAPLNNNPNNMLVNLCSPQIAALIITSWSLLEPGSGVEAVSIVVYNF